MTTFAIEGTPTREQINALLKESEKEDLVSVRKIIDLFLKKECDPYERATVLWDFAKRTKNEEDFVIARREGNKITNPRDQLAFWGRLPD